jgi:hypothetical protein
LGFELTHRQKQAVAISVEYRIEGFGTA